MLEGRGSASGPVSPTQLISLSDFPNEILMKIFSYFGPEDLCFIVAKVCERWNALARVAVLWKKLSYKCDRDSELCRVVRVSQNTTSMVGVLNLVLLESKKVFANCAHYGAHKHHKWKMRSECLLLLT
jgi:hypothetical protein